MICAGPVAHRPRLQLATVAALSLLHLPSCRDAGFVAELETKQATVERDFGRAPEVWSTAETGDRFEMGDAVRTGARAQATLALPRRARLLIKSDTVVRFKRSLDSASPRDQIEIPQGELTIDTGELDLGVITSRGVVTLTPGSSVRLRAEQQRTRFDVVVGRVEYTLEGAAKRVQAGAGFELDVLRASVEAEPPPLPATEAPSEAPPEAAKPSEEQPVLPGGKLALASMTFQEPPPSAIVTLPAGETATIHDPSPPTDVRMTFSGCPELAVLELDRGNGRFDALRGRGTGEVRARIPRGSFRYRLRCTRAGYVQPSALSSGRLVVVPDAATRPLPLAAASIIADADGRRYTVSYQNRLPSITLRWPDAPRGSAYRLFVQPEKGAPFSTDASRASIALEPGRVSEGVHRFWFETKDKQRSEVGILQVSFDYTARTAYLTSPLDGEPAQQGRARFAGGVLRGSSVQAQGVALKLDAQGRFATTVELPAGAPGAYVRVQHRSTGVHYYIRHLR